MSRREIKRSDFYPEHQISNPRVEGTFSTLLDDNMIPMNRLAQPPRNPLVPRRPNLKSAPIPFTLHSSLQGDLEMGEEFTLEMAKMPMMPKYAVKR